MQFIRVYHSIQPSIPSTDRAPYHPYPKSKRITDNQGFQSLAHRNVGHRHCVPFSLFPLGPSGRGQIQNARPQLIPGFLVVMRTHSSWWPSQGGGRFLVKSFDQSSLLAMGSMTVSESGGWSWDWDGEGGIGSEGVGLGVWEGVGLEGEEGRDGLLVLSEGVDFGLKKPWRVFWPADGADAGVGMDFVRLTAGGGSDRSGRLRTVPFGG